MSLVLSEEQVLLKDAAADFVRRESPLSRIRQLRDSQDPDGFSRDLWAKMAELGWQGIIVPEEFGGSGLGYAELACVLEECGKALVPEPLMSTVALGTTALLGGASDDTKAALLPEVVAGRTLLALAHHEKGARFDTRRVATLAEPRGDGFVLSGQKTLVWDGHVADKLIVSARTSGAAGDRGGVTAFLIDSGQPGLEIDRQPTVDLRSASVVTMNGVEASAADIIGLRDQGGQLLDEVFDRATVCLCAEMLGNMEAAFAMTLDYLKTRKQFGVPIGSFQALKHRAAVMFTEIELSRSAVYGACQALDAGADDYGQSVSVAKARCSDTAVLVGNEGIQMHGGIGMTDEHDIGFFAKRARASQLSMGDAAWHRDRFAALQGF